MCWVQVIFVLTQLIMVLMSFNDQTLPRGEKLMIQTHSKMVIEDWQKPFYTDIVTVKGEKSPSGKQISGQCPDGYDVLFEKEWPGMQKWCDCITDEMISNRKQSVA